MRGHLESKDIERVQNISIREAVRIREADAVGAGATLLPAGGIYNLFSTTSL
jgi:hypothetical protein